jgi:protein-tyrosine phosphatase
VFRSDAIVLHDEYLDGFAELGIRTVYDLRSDMERETVPNRFPEGAEPAVVVLPLVGSEGDSSVLDELDRSDGENFLAQLYVHTLERAAPAVGQILTGLAEGANRPAVFHCAAGKDRTGILASLVLALLRVPDDVIAADYALSQDAMQRLIEWAREHRGTFPKPSTEVPASVIEARPETMTRFLELVRQRFDSVEGLVRDLGLGDDVPGRIQAALLD